MSMNKVILVGRLGSDPELKTVGNNQTVARLAVATSESWTKDGQKHEKTEWHRIVVWGKLAEICGKYLSKGRQVLIEGKIQTRSWEDNGTKKYATEIVASVVQFLGNNNSSESEGSSSGGQKQQSKKSNTSSAKKTSPAKEEDGSGDFQDADFNFSDFGPEPSSSGSEDSGSGDIPF